MLTTMHPYFVRPCRRAWEIVESWATHYTTACRQSSNNTSKLFLDSSPGPFGERGMALSVGDSRCSSYFGPPRGSNWRPQTLAWPQSIPILPVLYPSRYEAVAAPAFSQMVSVTTFFLDIAKLMQPPGRWAERRRGLVASW
jgi:hypothetical protein